MKRILVILIGIVLSAILVMYLDGRIPRKDHGEPPAIRVDTLFVRDTIVVADPVFVTRRVVDSVPYPVTDTIRTRDTLFVLLERSQIRWEDSLAVIYASGIDPEVDSVIHYTRETIVTREIPVIQVKRTRWGIGVQAGFGAAKDGLTPYLGVGVSYNLLSW